MAKETKGEAMTILSAAGLGAIVPLFLTESATAQDAAAKSFVGAMVGATLAGTAMLISPTSPTPKNKG